MAIGPSNGHCYMVAHDLSAQHGHGLALGGVHFPRHDAGSRFVFWQDQLAKPTPRTTSQEANVVCYFH